MPVRRAEEVARALARGDEPVWDSNKGQWRVRCTNHADREPSLYLWDGDRGVAVKCHVCSDQGAVFRSVVESTGWPAQEFFWDLKSGEDKTGKKNGASGRSVVGTYIYKDEFGGNQRRVTKWSSGARFSQSRWNERAEKWEPGTEGLAHLPYRLPELNEADPEDPVFICEGEKDADTVVGLRLTGTCNVGGAGKWDRALNPWFAGRYVVILPDNDKVGRDHARAVARSLKETAARLKVVALPDLAEKGDVSDWVAAGGTAAQLLALTGAEGEWEDDGVADEAQPELPATGSGINGKANGTATALHGAWARDLVPDIKRYARLPKLDTPWRRINRHLDGGLTAGTVTVLTAGPGDGKTSLACQLAAHVARQNPVAYLSLEMGRDDIASRIAGQIVGCRWSEVGALRDEQIAAALDPLRLMIFGYQDIAGEKGGLDLDVLFGDCLKLGQGLPLVVIDYLGLLARHVTREMRLEMMTQIRGITTRTQVAKQWACFVLSQGSRESAKGLKARESQAAEDYIAVAAETAAIEQDSDVSMALSLVKQDGQVAPEGAMFLTKVRKHGPTTIGWRYRGDVGLHEELDTVPPPPKRPKPGEATTTEKFQELREELIELGGLASMNQLWPKLSGSKPVRKQTVRDAVAQGILEQVPGGGLRLAGTSEADAADEQLDLPEGAS